LLPPPKRDIAIFVPQQGGVFKFTADAIDSNGDRSPFMDSVIARRIDDRTAERIAK
jgi:hypothetical protein